MCRLILPNHNFYLQKQILSCLSLHRSFNSYFQQLLVTPCAVITGYLKAHSLLTEPSTKYDQGSYWRCNQPYKPIKDLWARHITLQQSNSQPQTTNEFLITPCLIFTILWDKQLWKALYLSDVINMHHWEWTTGKPSVYGILSIN